MTPLAALYWSDRIRALRASIPSPRLPMLKPPTDVPEAPEAQPPLVVREIDSALPAFIGYTARANAEGESLVLRAKRVGSLAEYEQLFGTGYPEPLAVTLTPVAGDGFRVAEVSAAGATGRVVPRYLLHESLQLYFANGGGPCIVVSVGSFDDGSGRVSLLATDDSSGSRSGLLDGLNSLMEVDGPSLLVVPDAVHLTREEYTVFARALLAHCAARRDRFAILDVPEGTTDLRAEAGTGSSLLDTFRSSLGEEGLAYGAAYYPFLRTSIPPTATESQVTLSGAGAQMSLGQLRAVDAVMHASITAAIAESGTTIPPGGAVAGVYVATDRAQGVWKAPASVPLSSVTGPAVKIDDMWQQSLNVDPLTGKSINAIRAFSGKGTLIWGARTLAGNDPELRYVPVRRLLIVIGESIRRSTGWVESEPNTAPTWAEVRRQIEDYLHGKWREGALQGTKPEAAYFVRCGLGDTMTQNDVESGRLIVEIGVAAIRPTEFVILRIQHTLSRSDTSVATHGEGVPTRPYVVEWEGVRLRFAEVSGLPESTGPGPSAKGGRSLRQEGPVGTLTLRGGTAQDPAGFRRLMRGGRKRAGADLRVTLLDESGNPAQRWRIRNGRPHKYQGPDLDASGNDVAIESLEISNEGIVLDEE